MSIAIIKADVSHAAAIAAIGKKSFRSAFGNLFKNKEELLEYLEHTYNPLKMAKSLRKPTNVYFIAMLDGKPAGFAKVKLDSLNEHIESIAQMELQKIYVLQEYQRLGIGTALLNEVKRMARNMNSDYLWVDTCINSIQAIRFHEKNGFDKIGNYFFTIGTQAFEYHVLGWPVAVNLKTAC